MHNNYHTLKFISEIFKSRFAGSKIYSLYTYRKNRLVVEIEGNQDWKGFELSVDPRQLQIMPVKKMARPKRLVLKFKQLNNRIIDDIYIHPFDRIIQFKFVNYEYRFILEFFGMKINFFLVDPENNQIIESFKKPKKYTNRSYNFPNKTKKIDPQNDSFEQFNSQINSSSNDQLKKVLLQSVATINGRLIDELLYRAEINDPRISLLTESKMQELWTCLVNFREELDTLRPQIYFTNEGQIIFSTIQLNHVNKSELELFDDIFEALTYFKISRNSQMENESLKRELLKVVGSLRKKTEKNIHKLEQDLDKVLYADQYRLYGELLAANIFLLRKGMKSITVPNIYDQSKMIEIPLDPVRTPAQNIDYYFKRAKKMILSQDAIKERIEKLNRKLNEVTSTLKNIEEQNELSEIKRLFRRCIDNNWIRDSKRNKNSPVEISKTRHYREYLIDNFWVVWVGKNNESNDVVTHKLARKYDYWFHAQGVSGSHIILRRENKERLPEKKILLKTASIAAYFSKAKHSGVVPVIYTERCYVRKPRKSKPGTAAVERAKTVFVKPHKPSYFIPERKG